MQTMGMKDVGTTCTQGFWNASLLAAIQGTHGGPWQEPGASHKECAGLPPADEPRGILWPSLEVPCSDSFALRDGAYREQQPDIPAGASVGDRGRGLNLSVLEGDVRSRWSNWSLLPRDWMINELSPQLHIGSPGPATLPHPPPTHN